MRDKRKQQMVSTGNVKSSQVATVVIDEQNALVTRWGQAGKWQVGAVTNPTADSWGLLFNAVSLQQPSHSSLCRLPPPTPPPPPAPSVFAETTGGWRRGRRCRAWTDWRRERGRGEGERKAREAAVLHRLWLPGEQGKPIKYLKWSILTCNNKYSEQIHAYNYIYSVFSLPDKWHSESEVGYSQTYSLLLSHNSWLWESCKPLIFSPWTAAAPPTRTWRSSSSLTRRRSLTQRFTRRHSIPSSMRPFLLRWAEMPHTRPSHLTE